MNGPNWKLKGLNEPDLTCHDLNQMIWWFVSENESSMIWVNHTCYSN